MEAREREGTGMEGKERKGMPQMKKIEGKDEKKDERKMKRKK